MFNYGYNFGAPAPCFGAPSPCFNTGATNSGCGGFAFILVLFILLAIICSCGCFGFDNRDQSRCCERDRCCGF